MLEAVIVLGVIGLIAGSGLAFASKYFHVVKDERIEIVKDMLSGANCGGCGYAGCAALAKAICAGDAPVSLCIALKDDEIKNISQLLGLKSSESIKKKAYIRCSGGINCQNRYEYFGPNDCLLMSQYDGGIKACKYGCVGGGTCENACPFNAIFVNENGIAEVDYEKCTGCGICVNECPKHLIFLEGEHKVNVTCLSIEKGAAQKKYCNTGCIGCKLCEKTCEDDAIHVNNFLASIDYTKCTSCGKCVEVCPCDTIKI